MPEVEDVDTTDEAGLREWYDVWRAAQPHRPPDLLTVLGGGPVPPAPT